MQTAPFKEWQDFKGIMKLCELVGVDPNTPMTIYTEVSLSGLDAIAPVNTGLVNYQWEEADELHLNGKVLWRTESCRFYQSILALINGKVEHLTMTNEYSEELAPYNDSVSTKCETCPNHGVEIESEVNNEWEWSQC